MAPSKIRTPSHGTPDTALLKSNARMRAEQRYNFIHTTNQQTSQWHCDKPECVFTVFRALKQHGSGFLLVAPTDRETWSACAACQSGLTTQTRSFREHICRYTGRVSHALYKNSSTLKDRVTECVYSTHIVKAVAEKTRHIASVIITLQVQQLFWDVVTEFFSVAKFRSSALLFLSLMRSARRVKHTTACVLFVAVFFFCAFLRHSFIPPANAVVCIYTMKKLCRKR